MGHLRYRACLYSVYWVVKMTEKYTDSGRIHTGESILVLDYFPDSLYPQPPCPNLAVNKYFVTD